MWLMCKNFLFIKVIDCLIFKGFAFFSSMDMSFLKKKLKNNHNIYFVVTTKKYFLKVKE